MANLEKGGSGGSKLMSGEAWNQVLHECPKLEAQYRSPGITQVTGCRCLTCRDGGNMKP